jgi:hypothetical protein
MGPYWRARRADQSHANGALAAPSTASLYDWNILPIGEQLWAVELES